MKSSYQFMQGASKSTGKSLEIKAFLCPPYFYSVNGCSSNGCSRYILCVKKFFCPSVIQSFYSITNRSKAKDLALFHTELSLLFKQSNISSSSQSTPDIYLYLHLVQNVQESKGLLYQEEHLCPSSLCLYL